MSPEPASDLPSAAESSSGMAEGFGPSHPAAAGAQPSTSQSPGDNIKPSAVIAETGFQLWKPSRSIIGHACSRAKLPGRPACVRLHYGFLKHRGVAGILG